MNGHRILTCLLALVVGASCAGEPPGQEPGAEARPSGFPDTEQWYFWTDDDVRHYVFEVGPSDGTGDPVVVLHGGWGAEHSYLVDAVEPLSDQFRFVLYDQRGSLRSAAPDSTLRLEWLVSDLEHLRVSLGLERMTLMGHSMGNALIYAYLSQHPERVRAVILVGPVHPAPYVPGGNFEFVREVWPDADSAASVAAFEEFLGDARARAIQHMRDAGLLPDGFTETRFQDLNEFLEGLGISDRERTRAWRINFASVNSCTGDHWRRMRGGMVYYSQATANAIVGGESYSDWTEEFWPALKGFEGPVAVIIGTCDYVDIGPMVWPHIIGHLAHGSLTVVDGAGHALWMDEPEAFSRALRTALGTAAESEG